MGEGKKAGSIACLWPKTVEGGVKEGKIAGESGKAPV